MMSEYLEGLTIKENLELKQTLAETNTPPGMKLEGWMNSRDNGDLFVVRYTLLSPSAVPVYSWIERS